MRPGRVKWESAGVRISDGRVDADGEEGAEKRVAE